MKKNPVICNDAAGETLTMLVSEEENSGTCQLYEVGLPRCPQSAASRFPTDSSEHRFYLCRFSNKTDGLGEKVAGLFHIIAANILESDSIKGLGRGGCRGRRLRCGWLRQAFLELRPRGI